MSGFGQFLTPQQPMDQALPQQQKAMQMAVEFQILKKGGPEAEALIRKKVAEGKMPPDFDQLIQQIRQASASGTTGRNNNAS